MRERSIRSRVASLAVLLLAAAPFTSCVSVLTSIEAEPDGRYAVTGWEHGPHGFVWIGEYDAATRTFTVLETRK